MTPVAILTRPAGDAVRETERFGPIIEALALYGLQGHVVHFTEETIEQVRGELITASAVLVWVDPISGRRDRSVLDPLLREVADAGVFVSTHPDVILKMGTKDVLVATRGMGWGTDTHLYSSLNQMGRELPLRLALGPRVLKQHRGNGGNGVWKVEAAASPVTHDSIIQVLHAQRESSVEEMTLAAFVQRCEHYFAGSGCMIDQAYQPRLGEGMVRCYLVKDRVAGFGHQLVTALLPLEQGASQNPLPSPRVYFGPEKPEFQDLKAKLESGWVKEMQELLRIGDGALPMLWDADFLLGPKDESGHDTYVLCEINVSSVAPFPSEVLNPLAAAVKATLSPA